MRRAAGGRDAGWRSRRVSNGRGAQQYSQVPVGGIGCDDVVLPVAIEVRHRQSTGSNEGGNGRHLLKGPVTFTEHDTCGVAGSVGDNQIEDAIAVEIAYLDGCPERIAHRWLECAVAITQQDPRGRSIDNHTAIEL